jgi:hypothetical protein
MDRPKVLLIRNLHILQCMVLSMSELDFNRYRPWSGGTLVIGRIQFRVSVLLGVYS